MGNLCSSTSATDKENSTPKAAKTKPNHATGGKSADTGKAAPSAKASIVKKPVLSWQTAQPLPVGFEARIVPQSRDPKDYVAENLVNEIWYRSVGQVADQRVNVDQCEGCTIYLVDQLDSVQVDDCKNCTFFIGPTMGSVFIRNCVDCKFVVACGQLRTRDLRKCQFSLFCQSRPVLEASKEIGLACYSSRHQYFAMRHHMHKAKLSVFNNLWSQVHDFTPHHASPNYYLIEQVDVERVGDGDIGVTRFAPSLSTIVPHIVTDDAEERKLYDEEVVIPVTAGITQAADAAPFRYVLIFASMRGGLVDAAALVRQVELHRRACDLVEQREVEVDEIDIPVGDDEDDTKDQEAKKELHAAVVMPKLSLISTVEHLFTNDDVEQLETAGLSRLVQHSGSSATSSLRGLAGDVCICLYLAADVPKHPIIENFRQQGLKASPSTSSLAVDIEVQESSDGTSSGLLSSVADHLFSQMPTQGTGFGAACK